MNFKIASIIVRFLTLIFLVSIPLQADSQHIRVGIYSNKPKVFLDKNGKPDGIFVEIFEEIADEEGWTYEYIIGTWSDHLTNLQENRIDLLPDVACETERDSTMSFNTISVLQSWIQIYSIGLNKISSFKELERKKNRCFKRFYSGRVFYKSCW